MRNVLFEKSPYLLQHAYNPVDWFAWYPEAFQKAQRESKAVFLSIGYSLVGYRNLPVTDDMSAYNRDL